MNEITNGDLANALEIILRTCETLPKPRNCYFCPLYSHNGEYECALQFFDDDEIAGKIKELRRNPDEQIYKRR